MAQYIFLVISKWGWGGAPIDEVRGLYKTFEDAEMAAEFIGKEAVEIVRWQI